MAEGWLSDDLARRRAGDAAPDAAEGALALSWRDDGGSTVRLLGSRATSLLTPGSTTIPARPERPAPTD